MACHAKCEMQAETSLNEIKADSACVWHCKVAGAWQGTHGAMQCDVCATRGLLQAHKHAESTQHPDQKAHSTHNVLDQAPGLPLLQ